MKTLKQITKLSLVVLLLTGLNACKKKNSDSITPEVAGVGSYTFGGKTINATRADYLLANGNAYLYVYGETATDIVQIRFNKVTDLPNGTFDYVSPETVYYSPTYNFSGGSVTNAANPNALPVSVGVVTVTKNTNDYTIKFDCTIANNGGNLKGSYTGKLVSR